MAKVSIVMTLYNGREHIAEALESALAQTYQDRDIVVIDDGSTDGSGEIVKQFAKRCGGAVRYEYQANAGAARATNRGVELSSGAYIAFLEHDDAWLPEKLERQVAVLDANPDIGAVNCDLRYFSRTSQPLAKIITGSCPSDPHCRLFLKGFNFMLSALMVRRAVFEATGGFHKGFKAAGLQDVEWYPRLVDATTVHWIPEVLTFFRQHDPRVDSETELFNSELLLDCLWRRYGHEPAKRRYLIQKRIELLSDRGKYRLRSSRIMAAREDFKAALRLAARERVAGKMAVRSALRLVRSYAGPWA
jgi:glycosyltransferase involved in cell wall biosynthesis